MGLTSNTTEVSSPEVKINREEHCILNNLKNQIHNSK
jgi:hypothetical protein